MLLDIYIKCITKFLMKPIVYILWGYLLITSEHKSVQLQCVIFNIPGTLLWAKPKSILTDSNGLPW